MDRPRAQARTSEYPLILDAEHIESITLHTSHHTHYVIGSGANDPQKYDPDASRETLDHSIPYIFTVALQDGAWHHADSYSPERAHRDRHGRALEEGHRRSKTPSGPAATTRTTSAEKAFGGRVVIKLADGGEIVDEIAVADAHPLGARPFAREQYVAKFRTLAEWALEEAEIERFLDVAQRLPELGPDELGGLTFTVAPGALVSVDIPEGLF